DLQMPKMDGYEAIEHIMAYFPTPILVISGKDSPMSQHKALSLGALEIMGKPKNIYALSENLTKRVKVLAKAKIVTHMQAKLKKLVGARRSFRPSIPPGTPVQFKALGIVASTGGPMALKYVFENLPVNLPLPVFVVQHYPDDMDGDFIEWLGSFSQLPLAAARDGDRPGPGHVYVAPSRRHMSIGQDRRILLIDTPPVNAVRPSGDILLGAIAKIYGRNAIGVVLTGMGSDGARGLKAVREAKGYTIAQDEETSVIFGMPGRAVEMEAADVVLPLQSIPEKIIELADMPESKNI
ncbi:MAG: chemotaxis protein CheB, partial [Pseudomonadota bacterium]